jgi:hypothetical protein
MLESLRPKGGKEESCVSRLSRFRHFTLLRQPKQKRQGKITNSEDHAQAAANHFRLCGG